ncbi:MAG: hypothetical protein JNM07_07320 [Phycisphaerae bacterium]|nr:hypothetical protein [Phycisphaerae bacterium]
MAVLPPVPVPPENPITESKRVLGKILFFDEQLSTANNVSCATCHAIGVGGTEGRPRVRNPGPDGVLNSPDDIFGSAGVIRSDAANSVKRDAVFGTGVQVTGRAAPTMINAAFYPTLFWEGRALSQFIDPQTGQVAIQQGGALESQAVGPPLNSIEMAHESTDWNAVASKLQGARPLDLATTHPADVAAALADRPSYPELFRRAFGDTAITARRIAFAIATYQRTLIANQTPFDLNTLTPQQAQGLQEFQNHSCAVCHSLNNGLFTDFSFRNIGIRPPQEDTGRQIITGNPNDRGRFKVPALRNVGLMREFMHNGQFTQIQQVIDFYARAPGAAPQFQDNIDPIIPGIRINPQDRALIDEFIRNGLTDPRVASGAFPFDRPVLFTERPGDRTTSVDVNGGVAGSGGFRPRALILAPSMIGNMSYRVGLDGALGGATASLGISLQPPQNNRITPSQFVGSVTAQGVGAGNGLATLHWPLPAGLFQPGDVVFAQWFVTDAGAPGGQALSDVLRIPIFCGSAGCCQPISAQVASRRTCPSQGVVFNVAAAGGNGAFTYQWQRETAAGSNVFVNLNDGSTASWDGGNPLVRGVVSGSASIALTLAPAPGAKLGAPHAIRYRCVTTNACGSASSGAASLAVCPADVNCDGQVDDFDLFDLLNSLFTQSAGADYNGDGSIDDFDYFDFLNAFNGAC